MFKLEHFSFNSLLFGIKDLANTATL